MFDMIIANPPYGKSSSLASQIVEKIAETVDEVICLCPLNTCKYKSVLSKCEKVEVLKGFENLFDATTGTLAILKLKKGVNNGIEYEDLALQELDEKLVQLRKATKLYNKKYKVPSIYTIDGNRLDLKFKMTLRDASKQLLPESFSEIANENVRVLLNKGYCFANTLRSVVDGVHFNDPALDRNYNFKGIWDENDNRGRHCDLIAFSTIENRNNFREWWYSCTRKYSSKRECNKRGLTNMYLEMLYRCVSAGAGIGYYVDYLPHLDWSRSWTDEEILKELGLPGNFLEEKE